MHATSILFDPFNRVNEITLDTYRVWNTYDVIKVENQLEIFDSFVQTHHHQPINVPTAGAQNFHMDYS
jgi:hypothetical protein